MEQNDHDKTDNFGGDAYFVLKKFFDSYLPDEPSPGKSLLELVKQISQELPEVVDNCGDILFQALNKNAPSFFETHHTVMSGFAERLRARWRVPLDFLERSIMLAVDVGRELLSKRREESPSDIGNLRAALFGLHARGCQVAFEVLTLLSSGYADGAHARWRTLHELAVIALFIMEEGDGVAERYLCHQYVEAYKEALIYQKYTEELGLSPLDEEHVARLHGLSEEMLKRYGKDFQDDYGWAAETLLPKRPTFANLRARVKLEHLHPQYKLACQNIHGAAKALFFRLGVPGAMWKTFPITLAGPSNAGLADPGIETAQSIFQITTALLESANPSFENMVILKALEKMVCEAQKAFLEVHQELENRSNEDQ